MEIAADKEFLWFFRALGVVGIIALPIFLLTKPAPKPTPPNKAVFGCYVSQEGPSIRLDSEGMHISQAGFPIVPFHLEWGNAGILLAADLPIRVDRVGNAYQFDMDRVGIGRYMDFYRVVDGYTYGVVDERLLQGFRVLASNGHNLAYDPADAAACS